MEQEEQYVCSECHKTFEGDAERHTLCLDCYIAGVVACENGADDEK